MSIYDYWFGWNMAKATKKDREKVLSIAIVFLIFACLAFAAVVLPILALIFTGK